MRPIGTRAFRLSPASDLDDEPETAERNLDTILAAVDLSPSVSSVLEYATRLAVQHEAGLHVLHVVEGLDAWWNPMKLSPESLEKLRREVSEKLDDVLSQFPMPPSEVDFEVDFGKASQAILDVVSARTPDLVVLGTEASHASKPRLLGSTAERVVTQSSRPVLTVPGAGIKVEVPPRRILVPTDLSLDFETPLQAALRIGGSDASSFEITLLHAVNLPNRYGARVGSWEDFVQGAVATIREQVEEGAEELRASSPDTTAVVQAGDPAEMILQYARTASIDLIALSSRGSVPKRPLHFGSTARQVVRSATCPVLTVSPDELD